MRLGINTLFKSDIKDVMTGCRAFSYAFVKTFPVLSKGFDIETEMTIHAVHKNMRIANVVIEYRDRPTGSESKLNTFKDGMRVIIAMVKLFKTYKPLSFFGCLSLCLVILAFLFFIPVWIEYLQSGLVLRFPTLIVCGFTAIAAIQSIFAGLILHTVIEKDKQDFEFKLQLMRRKM